MYGPRHDLAQVVLAVLLLCGLILASFWILKPFVVVAIWATTIVVATWPLLLAVERRLWGKRTLAVAVMTLALLGVVFVPFLVGVGALVANVDKIDGLQAALASFHVPALPDWVQRVPGIGGSIHSAWEQFVGAGTPELVARAAPYLGDVTKWLVGRLGGFGLAVVQFLLTIAIAAGLWANGETVASGIRLLARRIGGDRGENAVRLAGQAIRGVALGVVVTAIVQAALAGAGLLIAGVPYAPLLTAVAFMLCIAQLGPFLVLIPAIGWLYWSGSTGWGTFLLVWSLPIGVMDNLLRPILIQRGADLPLVLVFAGVVGGLLTLGLIGIFVGPVVLAVAYALVKAWVLQAEEQGG
jgi:predicted PurR-regulated permease PerM